MGIYICVYIYIYIYIYSSSLAIWELKCTSSWRLICYSLLISNELVFVREISGSLFFFFFRSSTCVLVSTQFFCYNFQNCSGCYIIIPQTEWLISNRNLFLTVLESGRSRSDCQYGLALSHLSDFSFVFLQGRRVREESL